MTDGAPPHVLMTADAVGGVWTYALDLCSGLAEAGRRTTLAVMGPFSPERRLEAERLGIRVVETQWPLDWLAPDAAALRQAGEACAALARSCGADLVHLNSPILAAQARFDRPVLGACHSCLSTWWAHVRGGAPPADFAWRTALLAKGYAACDALIAPSVAFAEETLRHYGVMPARLRNGRRLDGRRLQPAEKRPFVLTAGRLWDEGKNFGALDAAARLMRGPVLAAGPLQGPGGERVHAGAIQVLGPLGSQALTERLNAAAVFASLALYEPFGLTVLEAAQAGCALVLSDIPTFRELWGGVATFVNPSDPDEVAARLEGLLADPAETLRLGRLAAERSKRFSAEAMTAATLERYAALLGRPNTEAAA